MKKLQKLSVMLDCSRDAVYTVPTLKNFIDLLAKMGYKSLQLYTEDLYPICDPHFGYLRGRYTKEDLKELDAYCAAKGIELVPCIQTLAHLGGFLRWENDFTDIDDIMLADCDKTYEIVESMFATCAECFQSRRINVGMDEAHKLGLGKYLDKNGYTNRTEILIKHLKRVIEIANKYGFKPMMWSDMFFRLANHGNYSVPEEKFAKEVIEKVPQEVQLVFWDYYHMDKPYYDGMIQAHKQFKNDILFAGGAWAWSGPVPHNDFSNRANEAAMASCLENGVKEFIVTVWKDDGAESSLYSILPSLFAASQMAKGVFDYEVIKSKFKRTFKVDYDAFIKLDAPDDVHPETLVNPCKNVFYSDPFLGMFDYTVDEKNTAHFEKLEGELKTLAKGKYGYIFRTMSALCGVMKIKYALGVRTRAAYQAGDKAALKVLIEDYKQLEKNLEVYYKAFRAQWEAEAKTYGWEVHDIRLGSLIRRVQNCRRRIAEYLEGKTAEIAELAENILPYDKGWRIWSTEEAQKKYEKNMPPMKKGEALETNNWINIAMIKPNM